MKEERLWQLVSLKVSGEATAEDLAELLALLNENPDWSAKVRQFELLWQADTHAPLPKLEDAFSRHLQRLSNHFSTPALQYESPSKERHQSNSYRIRRLLWAGSIAATIIVAVVFIFLFNRKDQVYQSIASNIVTTKPGSKSKINLPDGTLVWLNADSKLSYNESFGIGLREVELSGEAYFDVVKDKTRPFIIHTKSIRIKVLGTAFNVRSYPDERTSETSLIRGLVEVTLNGNPDKKIILKPNEKLVVRDQPNKAAIRQKQLSIEDAPLLTLSQLHYCEGDSSSIETYWTKNKLAFEGETLENVAKKIERWYDVKITITSDALKTEKYTSVFEDESLTEVMNALRLTGNFNYIINRKDVIIKP